MFYDVENIQSLVSQAVEVNELDSRSELATNTSAYSCAVVVGASHGQLYALFYKKSNCWVTTALKNAVACIQVMRAKCGDVKSAKRLDIIENKVFNNDLNDGYFLLEVGAFKNPFDLQADSLPMFYSL